MKPVGPPKQKAEANIQFARFLVPCALALVVLAAYWPVFNSGFINFDDPDYVTANENVRQGLSLEGLRWAFSTGHMGSWHPLTWVSHMIDCQLFGLNAARHHGVNLLFHLGSTLVLFSLLRQMTGAFWQSAVVAGLFALHPTRVESVAWISERKDVMSVFFGLLSMQSYFFYTRGGPGKQRFYVFACGLFLLSLLSKPMLVTLPLALLLLDIWPLRRTSRDEHQKNVVKIKSLLLEKIPFVVLAMTIGVATLLLQDKAGAIRGAEVISFPERLSGIAVNYLSYLGKILWPANLSVIYPAQHHGTSVIAVAALLLALWVALVLWVARKRPCLTVGSLWFLATLLPVIGLIAIGHHSIADRYTYFPSIGLFIALIWGFGELKALHRFRNIGIGICGLVLVACAFLAHAQARHWVDSKSLFTHALSVTKNNYLAHSNLGFLAQEQGRHHEALDHFEAALKIRPNDSDLLNNRAATLLAMGKLEESIIQFESTLNQHPKSAQTRLNYGRALLIQGKPGKALEQFRDAINLDPSLSAAHLHFADISISMGNYDKAVAHYREVANIQPSNAEALTKLGSALADAGEVQEGLKHLRAALHLRPSWQTAMNNLAWVLATSADSTAAERAEALRLAVQASELTGGKHAPALDTLAASYAANGQFVQAAETAQRAIQCAEAAGLTALAEDAKRHLALYLARKPFHFGQAPPASNQR